MESTVPTPSNRGTGRGALALLVAALALLPGACGAEREASYEDPSYEDLVTSGRLAPYPGVEAGGERTCADETRFSVALAPGTKLQVPVELGEEPVLTLAACLGPSGGSATRDAEGSARLDLEIRGANGRSTQVELPVDGAAWTRETSDLTAFSGSRVELRLRARAPAGRPLLLSDLYLRHRLAPPRDGAAGKAAEKGSGVSRIPVLLVSLDTFRADALDPELTPALDAFAARAETWSPHYAGASWTKPSHATLLTGYPTEVHGAQLEPQPIDPGVPTLADRFARAGYRTGALVYDCEWLDAKWGFDRGFEEYRVVPWGADQAVRSAVDWMGRRRGEPFFYFLHLFTAHSDRVILPYEGDGIDRGTVEERFGVPEYGCRWGHCASQLLTRLNEDLEPIPQEERILHYLYAQGIATVDSALARLFRDLEALGLFDRMLIVVTSDHGEAFFEHGKVLHSTIHREVLQVPLLVKWPEGRHAGERRGVPSSAIDVAPTLLAATGIAARGLPGTPLHQRDPRQPVFAGTTHRTIVTARLQAIFNPQHGPRPGEAELYDLGSDPRERHDVAASHPEELRRLRERLAERLREGQRLRQSLQAGAEAGAQPEVELTPEERRRLEALGYVQ